MTLRRQDSPERKRIPVRSGVRQTRTNGLRSGAHILREHGERRRADRTLLREEDLRRSQRERAGAILQGSGGAALDHMVAQRPHLCDERYARTGQQTAEQRACAWNCYWEDFGRKVSGFQAWLREMAWDPNRGKPGFYQRAKAFCERDKLPPVCGERGSGAPPDGGARRRRLAGLRGWTKDFPSELFRRRAEGLRFSRITCAGNLNLPAEPPRRVLQPHGSGEFTPLRRNLPPGAAPGRSVRG